MFIKKIILHVCLLSVIGANCAQNEAQIKELKERRFKLELELSDLGKMITEKDELLQSIHPSMIDLIVKKIRDNNIDKDQVRELVEKNDAENLKFITALEEVFLSKKNIQQFLLKELFDEEAPFKSLKFYLIRFVLERDLLKMLVERYGDLQQNLFEIDQKLIDLKQ
jgi:hypothetical protein